MQYLSVFILLSFATCFASKVSEDDIIVINNGTVTGAAITEIDEPTRPESTTVPSKTTQPPPTSLPTPTSPSPSPPTTNSTTPATTPVTTKPTTIKPITTPSPPPPTPTTKPTTASTSTTAPIITTSAPHHERKFDGPSFVGGIILALGLVAIGFVAFKFYKARTELNYHTL